MIRLFFEADFSQVERFIERSKRALTGKAPSLMHALGRRMVVDFKRSVEEGDQLGEGLTGSTPGAKATESPRAWPRTHPQWQRLRNKDDKPLLHHGTFRDSFDYSVNTGEAAVTAGSHDIRSRRFHFGDAALGKPEGWSWSAPIGPNGVIIDTRTASVQPLGADLVATGGRWMHFSPAIQSRTWMVLYKATVDDWWREDMGVYLGLRA